MSLIVHVLKRAFTLNRSCTVRGVPEALTQQGSGKLTCLYPTAALLRDCKVLAAGDCTHNAITLGGSQNLFNPLEYYAFLLVSCLYALEHIPCSQGCAGGTRAAFRARVETLVQVALAMPALLCSLSLELTLKPRVELLLKDIGLPEDALPAVIARSA